MGQVVTFSVLGSLEVVGAEGPIAITAKRPQIVLMMLLLEANRVIPVERLIDAVWDGAPPNTARGQVQICVSMLRKIFVKNGIQASINTTPAGYVSVIDPGDVDLLVFEDRIHQARAAADAGLERDAERCCGEALSLWRGASLPTFNSPVLEAAAVRLYERRVSAIEEWTELRLRLGLTGGLVAELLDLVEQYPLRERLRAQLMRALHMSGRQAEALAVYRQGRQVLVEELGIAPGAELRQLEQAVLSGTVENTQASGSTVSNRELSGGFDDLGGRTSAVAAEARDVVPRLLPPDLSDFTGMTGDVAKIIDALRPDPGSGGPVVSVFGKAGVGKTVLAVYAGHQLTDDYPGGQLFISLIGLGLEPVDPAQALERFLRSLGVPDRQVPDGLHERAEMYRNLIADRRILIVLDDAADQEQILPLLPGTADCAALVTSRRRQPGLPGATAIAIDALSQEQGVQLLVAVLGSHRVEAKLTSSMELVALCGGLPIALRIVATRLVARPHWSVADLIDRLAAESDRLDELVHSGMDVRGDLGLTYQSLSPPAQLLLRRLGLLDSEDFPGWIAAPLLDRPVAQGQEVLEELVDAQLVDVDRSVATGRLRFGLHELTRIYAREKLATGSDPENQTAVTRMLGSWLYLAEQAHEHETGGPGNTLMHSDAARWPLPELVVSREMPGPVEWYDVERGNILAVIRQAADTGNTKLCWDMAISMGTLFEAHDHFKDWQSSHLVALLAARRGADVKGEAAILSSMGRSCALRENFDQARDQLIQAERLFETVNEQYGSALVQQNLAYVDGLQGRSREAGRRYGKVLSVMLRRGDRIGQAQVLSALAQFELESDRVGEAEDLVRHAIHCLDLGGPPRVRAQLTRRLGHVQLHRHDYVEADRTFAKAADLIRDEGDPSGKGGALLGLGLAAAGQGDTAAAQSLLSRALVLANRRDAPLLSGQVRFSFGELKATEGALGGALDLLMPAQRIFQELGLHHRRGLLVAGDGGHLHPPGPGLGGQDGVA